MKTNLKKLTVLGCLLIALCSFDGILSSSVPPQGYTGASGQYCTNCHSGTALNGGGGSVAATGLPVSYTAGTTYDFSIDITHSATNRRRFGFSVIAKNSLGQNVGSFSSNNIYAALNGSELSHSNPPLFGTTQLQQSYSFNNLSWTAPANPTTADQTITFYYVGNAANGSGSGSDFIYAGTKTITLLVNQTYTFTGNGNWSDPNNWTNGLVPPASISGTGTIVIDPVSDGECVLDVQQTVGSGATITVNTGKKFRVNGNLSIIGQ